MINHCHHVEQTSAMGKVTISVCSVIFKVDHIESEVEQVHAGSRKKKLDRDVSCDSQRETV